MMKVRILNIDTYTQENRSFKVGDIVRVHLKSYGIYKTVRTSMYLVEDKNKRPITMYSHQVEEMN